MAGSENVLSAESMEAMYGAFYRRGARLRLDRAAVPPQFWPLIPYAEFWGVSDDWARQALVREAPPEVQQNLKQVVALFDADLDDWLGGPEADSPRPSREYFVFSDLRMAAYFV